MKEQEQDLVTITDLKFITMERTKHLNTSDNNKRVGCLGRLLIVTCTLLILFVLFAMIAVDGFYKIEKMGKGYYVVGEVGLYDLEYQYHYLGELHSFPIPKLKDISTDETWIIIYTEDDVFWAIDKRIKPVFKKDITSYERLQIEFVSQGLLIGPMDSIQLKAFLQQNNLKSNLKRIVYHSVEICPNYYLVEHSRKEWYLAFKTRKPAKTHSEQFNIYHLSPVCKLGYDPGHGTIFCKSIDNTYWLINTHHKPVQEINPVDSLSYYRYIEKSEIVTILSIPSGSSQVKRLKKR